MDDRNQVLEGRLAELVGRRDALSAEIAADDAEVRNIELRAQAELERLDAAEIFEETSREEAERRRAELRAELAAGDERSQQAQRSRHGVSEFERRIANVQMELAEVRLEDAQERAATALRTRNQVAAAFAADPSPETRAALDAGREEAERSLSRYAETGGDAKPSGPLAELLDEPAWADAETRADELEQVVAVLRAGPRTPVADADERERHDKHQRRWAEQQVILDTVRSLEGGLVLSDLEHLPRHVVEAALAHIRAERAARQERIAASERDDGFPRVVRAREDDFPRLGRVA